MMLGKILNLILIINFNIQLTNKIKIYRKTAFLI